MLVVDIPRDVEKIRGRMLLKLTKRQLSGIAIAGLCGIPTYFLCQYFNIPSDISLVISMLFMAPGMFLMNDKEDVPLEKRVLLSLHFLARPRKRTYRKESRIRKKREALLKKEVVHVAKKAAKRQRLKEKRQEEKQVRRNRTVVSRR